MKREKQNKKYAGMGIVFMIVFILVFSSCYFIPLKGVHDENFGKEDKGGSIGITTSESTQNCIKSTRLPTALVRGFINDSTTMIGISDANIKFSPVGVGVPVYNDTDSSGYYEVELLTSGDYSINVVKSGYSLHNDQITVSVGNQYWYNVTLTPLSASFSHINGTVTDKKTGLPIQSAKVIFSGDFGEYYEATTNESGFYQQQVIPDYYKITATKEGYYSESEEVYIVTGLNITIDFKLTPKPEENATVKGYVYDNLGNPLLGALVWVTLADLSALSSGEKYTNMTFTNLLGYYEMNVPAGIFGVNASRADMLNVYTGLITKAHSVKWMNFTLEPKPEKNVNLICHVKAENGTPISNAEISMSCTTPLGDTIDEYTDSSGEASINLYASVYNINVYDEYGEYYTWNNEIYFERDGNYELTVTMTKKPQATVKISGKVLTSYGQPIGYADIDFNLIGTYKNKESTGTMSNETGYYQADLIPGIYNISCSYSGMNTSYIELNLADGVNYTQNFVLYNSTESAEEMRYTVNGTLCDVNTGKELSLQPLTFYKLIKGNWTRYIDSTTVTNETGEFSLLLSNGTYRVEAGGVYGYNASTPVEFTIDGSDLTLHLTVMQIPARTCNLYGYVFMGEKLGTLGIVFAIDKVKKYTEYTLVESDGRYEFELYPSTWEIAIISFERGISLLGGTIASMIANGYLNIRAEVTEITLTSGIINHTLHPGLGMFDNITLKYTFNSFSNIKLSGSADLSPSMSKLLRLLYDTMFGNRDGYVSESEIENLNRTREETDTSSTSVNTVEPEIEPRYFALNDKVYRTVGNVSSSYSGLVGSVTSNICYHVEYSGTIELIGQVPGGVKKINSTLNHGGIYPLGNVKYIYEFGTLPQPTLLPHANTTYNWVGNVLTITTQRNYLAREDITFTFPASSDTTPPTISDVTQLSDMDVSPFPIGISATVTDDSGVSTVILHYVHNGVSYQQTMTHQGSGIYSTSIGPLSAGSLEYWIEAQDNAGNTASSNKCTITITQPGMLKIVSYTVVNSIQSGGTVTIYANITNNTGVATLTLVAYYGGSYHNVTMSGNGVTYNAVLGPVTSDGTYRIMACDANGCVNSSVISFSVITSTLPIISDVVYSPISPTSRDYIEISCIVTSGSAVTVKLTYIRNEEEQTVQMEFSNGRYYARIEPMRGPFEVNITARDANGNSRSFLQSIPITATTISITMNSTGKFKPNSVMVIEGRITVNGVVNSTGISVTVYLDDILPIEAWVRENGTYQCNYQLPKSLSKGTHILKAVATCSISGANGTWTTTHKYTPSQTTTGGGPCGLPFVLAFIILGSIAIVIRKKESS